MSVTRLVHVDLSFRVLVDAKTNGIVVEVIHRVEMLEESITNQIEVLVLARESALVDDEVALLVARFVQVLLGSDLEHVVAHLEANRLDLRGDVLASVLDVAEGLVRRAVDVGKGDLPLGSDLLEHIRRDGQLGAASVDNGRVASVLTRLLHGLASVEHALTL